MESEIRRFTRRCVTLAKEVVDDPSEPAPPTGGGRFAEWTMIVLHCLRLTLGRSYRETVDLLSEMPHVLAEGGLDQPPHFTTFCDWFDRIPMARWRALLAASARRGLVTTPRSMPPASTKGV